MRALGLLAVLAAACGDLSSQVGVCASDSNCPTGQTCHPRLKLCVGSCAGDAQCTATEPTCAAAEGATASFCQCASDEGCAPLICSALTRRCSARCTATSCPLGSRCEAMSGQCG